MTSTERECGDLEKVTFFKGTNNIVVPACLKTTRPLDENLLRESVIHLISEQPNLRSRVAQTDDNGVLVFEPLSKIDHDVFEVLPADSKLEDLFVKYSNEPLRPNNNGGPLKVFYLVEDEKTSHLVAVFKHVVADGTNGMTIIDDILVNYTRLRNDMPLKCRHISPPPPVESMALSAASKPMANIEALMIDNTLGKVATSNTRFTQDSPGGKQRALFYSTSPQDYERFLKCCKQHQVTVGGALSAALYLAYASMLYEQKVYEDREEINIAMELPVNLRNRTPMSLARSACSLCIVQVMCCQKVSSRTCFWQLARDCTHEMRSLIEKECHLRDFNACDAMDERIDERIKSLGRFNDISISNMGIYPNKSLKYTDCTLESIYCLGGLWSYGWSEMELMVYSTDRFNLSLVYFDNENHENGETHSKKKERTQHVLDSVVNIIQNISSLDETIRQILE